MLAAQVCLSTHSLISQTVQVRVRKLVCDPKPASRGRCAESKALESHGPKEAKCCQQHAPSLTQLCSVTSCQLEGLLASFVFPFPLFTLLIGQPLSSTPKNPLHVAALD